MQPQNHERAFLLFREALAKPPGERDAWLEAACEGQPELLAEVRSLLAFDVEIPTAALAKELLGREAHGLLESRAEVPAEIGGYRIIEVIGSGGMGVVYGAEQENPERRVALKVLRPGVTSPDLLQRFEHEAQVLGWLEHPGIARIYEAGSEESTLGRQPFFAMEWVHGESLMEHCRSEKLGPKERLALVARVAEALHHAHQKGVIHRDLKPSNILVDATGQPKVLDFGIARISASDQAQAHFQTRTGELLGTLPYMSPEQLGGDPSAIDVRSDIYSLGVVAYQLLSGQLPIALDGLGTAAAVLAITQNEPRSLAEHEPSLAGDMDTVVRKALEKERTRRYGSMDEFAADIERCLRNEPIHARPASTFYHLTKFTQRNRLLVFGAAALVLALTLGIYGTLRFALREKDARFDADESARVALARSKEAVQQTTRAQAVNAFLNDELLAAANPTGISEPNLSVREVLRRAYAKLQEGHFGEQPLVRASILESIGRSYLSLSGFEEAESSLREAVELYSQELGAEHETSLGARLDLASTLHRREQFDQAKSRYLELEPLLVTKLGEQHPLSLSCRVDLARVHDALGEYDQALALLDGALAIAGSDPSTASAATLETMKSRALVLVHQGLMQEAHTVYAQVVQGYARLFGEKHLLTVSAKAALAGATYQLGDYAAAIELYLAALEIMGDLIGDKHEEYLGHAGNLALCYTAQNRFSDAEPILQHVYDASVELYGADSKAALNALLSLSSIYVNTGQFRRALPLLEVGFEGQMELLGEAHDETLMTMNGLGVTHSRLGNFEDAEFMFSEVLHLRREHFGDEHHTTIAAMSALAHFMTQRQRMQDAEPLHAEAVQLSLQTMPDHMYSGVFLSRQAINFMQERRFEEATEAAQKAYAILELALGAHHRRCADVARLLADIFGAVGQPGEELRWRKKSEAQAPDPKSE